MQTLKHEPKLFQANPGKNPARRQSLAVTAHPCMLNIKAIIPCKEIRDALSQ